MMEKFFYVVFNLAVFGLVVLQYRLNNNLIDRVRKLEKNCWENDFKIRQLELKVKK